MDFPSMPNNVFFVYLIDYCGNERLKSSSNDFGIVSAMSLTILQLAQVVITSCVVSTGLLLLRRCSRRSSRGATISETVYVAQPVRVRPPSERLPGLSKMRKPDLIAECRIRNIPCDGTVRDLQARLRLERARVAQRQVLRSPTSSRRTPPRNSSTATTNLGA